MTKYDNTLRLGALPFRLAGQAANLLLPPRCPVTGDIVDRPGMVSPGAWSGLRFVSAPQCTCCGLPFDVLIEAAAGDLSESLCGPCLAEPKPYGRARSSLVYDDASRDLILAFKHGDQTHLTVTFAPWLMTAALPLIDDVDVIVPVPLHWLRMVRRRYNQAALLGGALGRLADRPCWPDVLLRQRNTKTQGHLNARQRHENVSHAFNVREKYKASLQGKNVLLIDDVYTTGATILECTKTLLKAGAQRVDVLTLARVVRPDTLS